MIVKWRRAMCGKYWRGKEGAEGLDLFVLPLCSFVKWGCDEWSYQARRKSMFVGSWFSVISWSRNRELFWQCSITEMDSLLFLFKPSLSQHSSHFPIQPRAFSSFLPTAFLFWMFFALVCFEVAGRGLCERARRSVKCDRTRRKTCQRLVRGTRERGRRRFESHAPEYAYTTPPLHSWLYLK